MATLLKATVLVLLLRILTSRLFRVCGAQGGVTRVGVTSLSDPGRLHGPDTRRLCRTPFVECMVCHVRLLVRKLISSDLAAAVTDGRAYRIANQHSNQQQHQHQEQQHDCHASHGGGNQNNNQNNLSTFHSEGNAAN